MSVKSKAFAAAAALALAGGFSAAGTHTANAATKDCGGSCIDLFSRVHGTAADPASIIDAQGDGSGHAGQPVVLASARHTSHGEDFTIDFSGQVSDFIRIGLISHGMTKYKSLMAYELQYSPGGSPTSNCLGVGTAASDLTPVALEPCGRSGQTMWICDPVQTASGTYFTLISGATNRNFADPLVLSVPAAGGRLVTLPLKTSTKAVFLRQQWGSDVGTLKSGQPGTSAPLCGAGAV
jgi:hypothetical protein